MAGTAAGAAKRAAARKGAATPQDRKSPTPRAARVRKSTVSEMNEMPGAQVETLGELDVAEDGSLDFTFEGKTYHVHSPAEWRQSAMAGLRDFDFNSWAVGAMDEASSKAFIAADLTNRQAAAFMEGFYAAFEARFGSDPKALRTRLVS